jgi:hypothetical protein
LPSSRGLSLLFLAGGPFSAHFDRNESARAAATFVGSEISHSHKRTPLSKLQ